MNDQEFHEQIGCYCEQRPITESALDAANRIIHGDGSENDAQLVSGVLIQVLSQTPWKSEWRTGREWVALPDGC